MRRRDETMLASLFQNRADLGTLESLGLAVSVRRLGLWRQDEPVTHLTLEVHRFLLRPIIRALPWPGEHLMVGSAERIAAQERHLDALRDALTVRLRRRLQRVIANEAWWMDDVFQWNRREGGWLLCPGPFTGLEERVWLGPAAERWR